MRESLRQSLFRQDPGIGPVDMHTLVGIAAAIEHESVRRYAMLADALERRGDAATAAAFRAMCDEERRHVDAVEHWAQGLDEPVPPPEDFEWQLPPDLWESWDEVVGSALLTPYRAFSIAVVNEQRAFSFYTYLSAHATSERVRIEAERLAGEELRHAALMRQWRREAWHRARRETPRVAIDTIADLAELRERIARREATIAACHAAVAARLRDIGDPVSARVLEEQLATVSAQHSAAGHPTPGSSTAPDPTPPPQGDAPDENTAAIAASTDALHLLVIAQKPLEALAERLETVMAASAGELFDESTRAMEGVIGRLAQIGLRVLELQGETAGAQRPAVGNPQA